MSEESPSNAPLILDIGAHRGADSEFYLKKGFSVVAVDADPKHVQHCRARFAAEIASGRYRIVHGAIAPIAGEVTFYVNLDKDDWSSTDPAYGARGNTRHETITVPAIPFDRFLAEHVGDRRIHYLKSDIEGGDLHVLTGLLRTAVRPPFVSFEAHDVSYFAYLHVLGYRRFKLVNQNLVWRIKLEPPAREGRFVEHVFGPHTSGPFGEETPGAWMGLDKAIELYQAIRRSLVLEPAVSNAWFDIHATFDA